MFLLGAGHEPRDVDECHHREIERVTKPNEPGALLRGLHGECPGAVFRLVGKNPDGDAVQPREPGHEVPSPTVAQLVERALVHDRRHHLASILALPESARHNGVEFGDNPVGVVEAGDGRW